jgi:hypothetical protein
MTEAQEERAKRLLAEIPSGDQPSPDLVRRTEEALAAFNACRAFEQKWGISVLEALRRGMDDI